LPGKDLLSSPPAISVGAGFGVIPGRPASDITRVAPKKWGRSQKKGPARGVYSEERKEAGWGRLRCLEVLIEGVGGWFYAKRIQCKGTPYRFWDNEDRWVEGAGASEKKRTSRSPEVGMPYSTSLKGGKLPKEDLRSQQKLFGGIDRVDVRTTNRGSPMPESDFSPEKAR